LNGKTQFQMLVCDKVYQAKSERGQRTAVTAVVFHPGGREFALGTSCGSIQIWNSSKVAARPDRLLFHAHGTGKAIHNLVYNIDGTRLSSRSMHDDSVRVWNPQRLSRSASPLAICTGIPTVHEPSNSAFNPESNILCAGTSEHYKKGEQNLELGTLKFFSLSKNGSEEIDALLGVQISSVVGVVVVKWHCKLNQIFVGCSDGR
jgi:WD40 repeat protein